MESNNEYEDMYTNSLQINKQGKGKIKQILSISQDEFSNFSEEDPHSAMNNTMRQEDPIQKNIFDHDVTINYHKSRHKNLPYKKRPSKININNQKDITQNCPIKEERSQIEKEIKHSDTFASENSGVFFTVKILKVMNRKEDRVIEILNLQEGSFIIRSSKSVRKILYFI